MKCRLCLDEERGEIIAIVNAAAEAYRGVIPAERWREPYMEAEELEAEIAAGVRFWGCDDGGELVGVMGVQAMEDVDLIRHAYVRPSHQRRGVGASLLSHLLATRFVRHIQLGIQLQGTFQHCSSFIQCGGYSINDVT